MEWIWPQIKHTTAFICSSLYFVTNVRKALSVVAEAAGFSRAPGRVVLGIEEQHEPPALHRGGSAKVTVLILQAEGGEPVADPEGHSIEMKRLNPRQQAPCPGRENQGREDSLRHA